MLDTNVFRYHQLNIIVTNASTTCFQGPRLILNEPKYKLMNIHNKIEQWLRLRTRLVPLVLKDTLHNLEKQLLINSTDKINMQGVLLQKMFAHNPA